MGDEFTGFLHTSHGPYSLVVLEVCRTIEGKDEIRDERMMDLVTIEYALG